jgi:hypothetical protein
MRRAAALAFAREWSKRLVSEAGRKAVLLRGNIAEHAYPRL